jgi:photosystem II stability/assembly factor-like uncharacterized protein
VKEESAMKKSVSTFFFCIFCIGAFLAPLRKAAGDWTQTSGPEGCKVISIVGGGNKVFCAIAGHGIYFSPDNGARWSAVKAPLPTFPADPCIMWSNGTLFAGLAGLVLFSTDDGASWRQIRVGPPDKPTMSWVICLALIGTDLFIGTSNEGDYVCLDYTRNPEPVQLRLSKALAIRSFAVVGQELYASNLVGAFFRFRKDGPSWAETEIPGPKSNQILCLLANGPDLFAGTGDGVFRSSDRGASWDRITPRSSKQPYVKCLGPSGSDILAGFWRAWTGMIYEPGIRLSRSGGREWTVTSLGFKRTSVECFGSTGRYLYAGTIRGVLASPDGGTTWKWVNAGLPVASSVTGLATIGQNLFAATSQRYDLNGGLCASPDGGETWKIVDPDLAEDASIRCLAGLGTDLFAGVSEHDWSDSKRRNSVIVSSDNGGTWVRVSKGLSRDSAAGRLAVMGSTILAGTSDGVFETRDKGAHWTRRGRGLPAQWVTCLLAAGEDLFAGLSSYDYVSIKTTLPLVLSLLAGGQRLFAGGPPPTGRLFVLRNGDPEWTDTRIRFSRTINCLARIGTKLFVGTDSGLYFCPSDLRAAEAHKLEPASGLAVASLAVLGTDLLVGSDRGVHILRPAGQGWRLVDTGLPGKTSVSSLAMNDTFLFAGTREKGVWRLPLSELKKMRP